MIATDVKSHIYYTFALLLLMQKALATEMQQKFTLHSCLMLHLTPLIATDHSKPMLASLYNTHVSQLLNTPELSFWTCITS